MTPEAACRNSRVFKQLLWLEICTDLTQDFPFDEKQLVYETGTFEKQSVYLVELRSVVAKQTKV